jgi:hypothetical protein
MTLISVRSLISFVVLVTVSNTCYNGAQFLQTSYDFRPQGHSFIFWESLVDLLSELAVIQQVSLVAL